MVFISRYALTEQKRELQLLKEMVRSVRVGGAGTGRGLGDQLEDDEVMVLVVMIIVILTVMMVMVMLSGDAVGGDAAPGAGDEVGRHDLHAGRGAAGEDEARPGGGDHSDSVPGHDQAQSPGVRLSRTHCQRAHGECTRETVIITHNVYVGTVTL